MERYNMKENTYYLFDNGKKIAYSYKLENVLNKVAEKKTIDGKIYYNNELVWMQNPHKKYNIDIEKFIEKFRENYKFLYDNNDNVAGYREALEDGDKFIKDNPNFIGEFVKYRGDFISSDREVVAFMFTLEDMIG